MRGNLKEISLDFIIKLRVGFTFDFNKDYELKIIFYLKTKPDCVQINCLGILNMFEPLSKWINTNFLSLCKGLANIFPPDTLNAKVLKLNSHGVIVYVHGADSFLATIATNLIKINSNFKTQLRIRLN